MKCYLKKISLNISDLEKEMYKEIPESENGAINNLNCDGSLFEDRLKERIDEEHALLDSVNTPRITFILYDDGYPVGEVMIRPVLNKYWYNASGNIGYKIRPSKRGIRYVNEMLRLALIECKKRGLSSVRLCALNSNEYSIKVILKNGGIITERNLFDSFYKIDLRN